MRTRCQYGLATAVASRGAVAGATGRNLVTARDAKPELRGRGGLLGREVQLVATVVHDPFSNSAGPTRFASISWWYSAVVIGLGAYAVCSSPTTLSRPRDGPATPSASSTNDSSWTWQSTSEPTRTRHVARVPLAFGVDRTFVLGQTAHYEFVGHSLLGYRAIPTSQAWVHSSD
jgi:hypothetical protein